MPPVSAILIFLLFSTLTPLQSQNSSCPPSSCGDTPVIRFPFRLTGDHPSCGFDDPIFALRCHNNQTTLIATSKTYHVLDINYNNLSIRLVDPGLNPSNLSSCPAHNNDFYDWSETINSKFFDWNTRVAFIDCSVPVITRPDYIEAPFCSNRKTIVENSTLRVFSYVTVGGNELTPVPESCRVDKVSWASTRLPMRDNESLAGLYEGMGYGFELSWFRVLCGECERSLGACGLEGNRVTCRHYCSDDTPISQLSFGCRFQYYGIFVAAYTPFAVVGLLVLRFLIGLPFLIGVIVYKWRRRHRFMEEARLGSV